MSGLFGSKKKEESDTKEGGGMCVCVCVFIYVYVYLFMCMFVCENVCARMLARVFFLRLTALMPWLFASTLLQKTDGASCLPTITILLARDDEHDCPPQI